MTLNDNDRARLRALVTDPLHSSPLSAMDRGRFRALLPTLLGEDRTLVETAFGQRPATAPTREDQLAARALSRMPGARS